MLRFQGNGRKPELITFLFSPRVIAWLNEVATVAQNNTSRRFGKKKSQNYCLRAKPWMETSIQSFPYVI